MEDGDDGPGGRLRPRQPQPRVALIEVLDRDGRVLRAVDVAAWPFTIGRALDCDLVLDDPHVAPHHATLAGDADGGGGGAVLTVGDSRNGAAVRGRVHGAGTAVALAPAAAAQDPAALVLGQTRLRLRLPGDALAPERELPARPRGAVRGLWIAGAALAALTAAEFAIERDPGDDATAWLPLAVGLPAMVMAWCAAWALLSKLFQHRFEFGAHLRVALPWLLALQAASALLPLLGAALGWPLLWRLAGPAAVLLAAAMVRQHLLLLLPAQPRRVTAAVLSAVLAGGAIHLAFVHRATDRLSRPPYMSTLPPPAVNLAREQPVDAAVGALDGLAERVRARARQRAGDETGGEDE